MVKLLESKNKVEKIMSTYNLKKDEAELWVETLNNLNTEKGYNSFAKLVNLLLDRGYSKKEVYSTVIDLEMEFSWSDNFSKEMEKRNIDLFK